MCRGEALSPKGAPVEKIGAAGTPAARQQHKGEWTVDRPWTLDLGHPESTIQYGN